ncbi:hypothetical protein Plec18170_008965 [Paecilomyces lecythidis]
MRRSEILVHVSAPSRAKDDARYRALAAAAAVFEPVSRQCVFPAQQIDCSHPGSEGGSARPTVASSFGQEGGINSGDELDSVVSRQKSLSEKAQSVIKSPSPDSEEPRELISISSTDLPPGLPDNEGSFKSPPGHPLHLQSSIGSTGSKEDTISYQQSQQSCVSDSLETPLSVIPDSQPIPPAPEADDGPSEHSQPPDVQVERSFHSDVSNTRKRRRLNPASSTGSSTTDMRVPSSLLENGEELEGSNQESQPEKRTSLSHDCPADGSYQKVVPESGQPPSLDVLPLMLYPPSPPVSTGQFSTHVTPTLRMLTERLKISRVYQPLRQTRELDKLERGFWYVRICIAGPREGSEEQKEKQKSAHGPNSGKSKQWTMSLFTRFWSFLTDFIVKEGRAGWGVWCILEEASAPEMDTDSPSGEPEVPSGHVTHSCTQLDLKVYTWGEVAPHVYLLLFLASERRIRGMGAQWKDSAEDTIIEMP